MNETTPAPGLPGAYALMVNSIGLPNRARPVRSCQTMVKVYDPGPTLGIAKRTQ